MIRYRRNLYQIIDLWLPGAEIGVAEGYFSRDILDWPISKLYMVDNWGTIPGVTGDGNFDQEWHEKNYQSAMVRIEPVKERAVVLRGLSVDMSREVEDNSLGFLYLDAGHSYEAVMADLHAWYPKVKKGGVIAGHDYLNAAYGVFAAVRDFTNDKVKINTIPEDKKEDAGFYFIKP